MPIPAYARNQMTTTEKKRRIDEIGCIYHALTMEQVSLQLEVEEEENRLDSHMARWCRAWLAGNMVECDRLTSERYPEVRE
jgi:hypothetical protein